MTLGEGDTYACLGSFLNNKENGFDSVFFISEYGFDSIFSLSLSLSRYAWTYYEFLSVNPTSRFVNLHIKVGNRNNCNNRGQQRCRIPQRYTVSLSCSLSVIFKPAAILVLRRTNWIFSNIIEKGSQV